MAYHKHARHRRRLAMTTGLREVLAGWSVRLYCMRVRQESKLVADRVMIASFGRTYT